MSHQPPAFQIGTIATGVSSRSPQLVVHQAAVFLRQLLDDGVAPDDPRCLSLLHLVNAARFILVPNSNNGAKIANDLTSKAVHMDISTASMAAIMGLKNATQLTGAAVAQVTNVPSNRIAVVTSSERLSLRLLPKSAQKATDALLELVRTDTDLGARARNEALQKSSTMAHKLHKLRAGQRHAIVRKRRLADAAIDNPPPSLDTEPAVPRFQSAPPPLSDNASPGTIGFARFILPRRRSLVYSSPVPLPMEQVPTSSSAENQSLSEGYAAPVPQPGVSADQNQHSDALFSRFRPRELTQLVKNQQVPSGPLASSSDKGVMNDTIGTPNDIMEAFMHPLSKSYQAPQDPLDNATKIRSVLAERERILYRLLRRRQSELAAMPLGMTEQTRRKAIIEAKQLSLLDLQRVARYRVCAEMKKMDSLAVQEDGVVPTDNLSRLFRRRDPPIYSYTDGYPRITPYDGIPEMQPRPSPIVAQDSMCMAQFDMSRMQAQKLQRRKEFNSRLLGHFENFQNFSAHARNCRARIWKGFERYFQEKKRIEEKRRKMERLERLRLLRSNDEQAYLNLLKDTKNERLLQLVRQTDSYLMRIGAQVEKSREQSDIAPSNTFTDELDEQDLVPIDAMRRRRDMYYTVTHTVQEEVRQPSIMVHGTLKQYQVEGLKWMVSLYNNNLNGILADEMGLGKTIQTISLITYLVETKKNPGPFLIIVPLSTMGNWIRELDLWAPSLVKVAYRGDKHTRRAIQQKRMSRNDYNVLLTTYEFTVKDQQILSRVHWQYIIIDEGHRMKNANCKLAMTLGVKYKSRNRLLLTGTPLQNNLTELWALLNFLLPTIFSSADTFETWFKQPFESTTLGDTAELEEEETLLVINRLHQVLRPFLLRRLKTDVEAQLPQKVEHVIRCDMSAWQRVLYRQVQSRIGLATGQHNGTVRAYNNLLMQCKKICNHPYLFYGAEAILDLPPDHLIRASGKFFLLQHMLPKLRLHGHRTLIFSQMTAALDYLEDFLSLAGIQYMRLDGNTRADDRQELLNRFNANDSPYFCFLLSTRAGGLGLNLQTADTVIIFDSDWNPMMDLQAQDRAHRIGQTKVVRVYRLICSGTVEVKILEQANRKLQVDAQVIQAGQFNNKSTELDRHQMLKSMLRQKSDDGDELGLVPEMEELNRLFARSEEEFESFCKFDAESLENETCKPLFKEDSELPEWVLQPDVEYKTEEQREQEILKSHGRGRRQRKETRDMDLLTEAEWLKVMEGDITIDEAFERRKRRASTNTSDILKGSEDGDAIETPADEDASASMSREDETPARNENPSDDQNMSGTPSDLPLMKRDECLSSSPVEPPRRFSRIRRPSSKRKATDRFKMSKVKNRMSVGSKERKRPSEKGEWALSSELTVDLSAPNGSHIASKSQDSPYVVLLKLRLRDAEGSKSKETDIKGKKRKGKRAGSSVPTASVGTKRRKRQRTSSPSPHSEAVRNGALAQCTKTESAAVSRQQSSPDRGNKSAAETHRWEPATSRVNAVPRISHINGSLPKGATVRRKVNGGMSPESCPTDHAQIHERSMTKYAKAMLGNDSEDDVSISPSCSRDGAEDVMSLHPES